MPTYKTIIVKGPWERDEDLADAAITPGHLCETTTTGVKKHATLGGNAEKMFAIEDDHQGNDISDAYVAANRVQLAICSPGAVVYALLKDGENAARGNFLESAGDGTLQVLDADASVALVKTNSIVGVALEAVDMSGSAGVDPSGRILVRIC